MRGWVGVQRVVLVYGVEMVAWQAFQLFELRM